MRRESFSVTVLPVDALGPAEAILGVVDKAEVIIATTDGEALEFATLMCATEYLMHLTAERSGAGYDRALDLLLEGARMWSHQQEPDSHDAA